MITLYIVCKYSHNNSVDILERDSLLLLRKSSSSAKLWHFSEVECLAWGFNCLHDNCWFWMMEISMNIGMLRPIRKTEFISIATNNVQNNYLSLIIILFPPPLKKAYLCKYFENFIFQGFQDWDCGFWLQLLFIVDNIARLSSSDGLRRPGRLFLYTEMSVSVWLHGLGVTA